MKHLVAFTIVLHTLLLGHTCLAAEETHHEADVCVYGGTASGVMAALAAEREGAKVILIEPSRWLGGMTGGGINHLDWGKGNTVGGSTYKILMEGLEVQGTEHHGGHAIQGIGNKAVSGALQEAVEDRGITVIYEHRLGKVQVGDATIDAPTRQQPIAMGEDIARRVRVNPSGPSPSTTPHSTKLAAPSPSRRNAMPSRSPRRCSSIVPTRVTCSR